MEVMKTAVLKGGRQLTIRDARAADAAAVIEYVKRVAGESDNLTFGAEEFKVTLEQEVEIIEQHFAADNMVFLIGLIDGEVAAMLNFQGGTKRRTRHSGEFGISVRESFWGQGVATAMLQALLGWAKGTGVVRKINLRVRTDNQSAIHVYKKLGFTEVGRISREFLIDGVFYDTYLLEIEIDEA